MFTVFGIFFVTSSLYVLISLVSHYHDNLQTVLEARATPECVVLITHWHNFPVGSRHIKAADRNANFYSRYFEGDLSGYIQYRDLAESDYSDIFSERSI